VEQLAANGDGAEQEACLNRGAVASRFRLAKVEEGFQQLVGLVEIKFAAAARGEDLG
jgi:hypothetical protein